uniref:EamA domain-containing protein n=1 Tax=Arcella intermedia TaxID=1963864 RepID=A0A6B2L9X7_9EUKA
MLFFGSFNIPLKMERTRNADPDPMIFQIYFNIIIFASSFLALTVTPFVLSPWGILSGALWVTASILSIFAIKNAGLAVSQGVWSGFTMIVSFFWGAVIFKEPASNLPLAIVGLLLLLVGVGLMSLAGSHVMVPYSDVAQQEPLNSAAGDTYGPIEPESPTKKLIIGISCAILLSIPNGSMLAPQHYAEAEGVQGIGFLVSFGFGVLAITPLFAFLYFFISQKEPLSLFKPKVLLLPGLLGGFGWNVGNAASIYAINYLGFVVGFPLCQCALLVGGFWGIFLFKEITGWKRILVFSIGALILVGGAVMLAFFGKK